MARTKGRYFLETLKAPINNTPLFAQRSLVRNAATNIFEEWVRMGCPEGEFLIEFAEREDEPDA